MIKLFLHGRRTSIFSSLIIPIPTHESSVLSSIWSLSDTSPLSSSSPLILYFFHTPTPNLYTNNIVLCLLLDVHSFPFLHVCLYPSPPFPSISVCFVLGVFFLWCRLRVFPLISRSRELGTNPLPNPLTALLRSSDHLSCSQKMKSSHQIIIVIMQLFQYYILNCI